MKTLSQVVYETVHHGKLPIDELADLVGVSANLLYRAANPSDATDLQLKRLLAIMKAQGSYAILDHLNQRSGRLYVNVGRIPASRADAITMSSDFQDIAARAVKAFTDYLKNPNEDEKDGVIELLDALASTTIGNRKRLVNGNQLELL